MQLKARWSLAATIVTAIAILIVSFFYYPRYKQGGGEATISYDVSGYYWYLPSVFIYHDIKHQSFKDSILTKYAPTHDFQQAYKLPNGKYVLKYSSGQALLYTPFFFAAHVLAPLFGYRQDGFSRPYQLGIQVGGLLVSIVGLFLFRRLLLQYFNDRLGALLILLLVAGTNYINFAAIDTGMTHTWLFTLYCALLLLTNDFHKRFRLTTAAGIGAICGLMTLIRPTECISLLLPALWGIERLNVSVVVSRIKLFYSNSRASFLLILLFLVFVSIQLVYWKYVSGNWFVYSYQDQRLNLKTPHFFDYTFNYRNGWLLYTPMLLLAVVALPVYAFKGRNKVALITFALVNYYLVASWSIWWYGGRAMVQSYPVLFLFIGTLLQTVGGKRVAWWLTGLTLLLFAYINIWFTHQCHRGTIFRGDYVINGAYFWKVIGRWQVPAYTVALLDNADWYTGKPAHETPLAGPSLLSGRRSISLDVDVHDGWVKADAIVQNVCSGPNGKMTQWFLEAYYDRKLVKRSAITVQRVREALQSDSIMLFLHVPKMADSIVCGLDNNNTPCELMLSGIHYLETSDN